MKIKRLIILVILPMILTSCWDKVEIDQRAFIYLMAVDADKKNNGIKSVFFSPIPSKLIGGSVDAYTSEEASGKELPDAISNLSMNLERTPFFGQTKVLVVGEKLLKDDKKFKECMDFFEREHEINRDIKFVALKGEIKDLEKIKPSFEKIFAFYVMGLLNNVSQITPILSPEIHEVFSSFKENKGNVVVPYMKIENGKIKIDGITLIKNYKFLKYIGIKYVVPYAELIGKLNGGKVIVKYKGSDLSYDITSFQRKIWMDEEKKGNLRYKMYFKFEGDVEEVNMGYKIFSDKDMNSIRKELETKIRGELSKTLDLFQKQIGVDYLNIGDYTQKYHNKTYEKYKNNWDSNFKKAQIDCEVNVFVRRIGTSK